MPPRIIRPPSIWPAMLAWLSPSPRFRPDAATDGCPLSDRHRVVAFAALDEQSSPDGSFDQQRVVASAEAGKDALRDAGGRGDGHAIVAVAACVADAAGDRAARKREGIRTIGEIDHHPIDAGRPQIDRKGVVRGSVRVVELDSNISGDAA